MSRKQLTKEKEEIIEESTDMLALFFVDVIDQKYKRKNKKKNHDK